MDTMHISGTQPSSVIIGKTIVLKIGKLCKKVPKQAEGKRDVVIKEGSGAQKISFNREQQ